jgi:hypothetical protein
VRPADALAIALAPEIAVLRARGHAHPRRAKHTIGPAQKMDRDRSCVCSAASKMPLQPVAWGRGAVISEWDFRWPYAPTVRARNGVSYLAARRFSAQDRLNAILAKWSTFNGYEGHFPLGTVKPGGKECIKPPLSIDCVVYLAVGAKIQGALMRTDLLVNNNLDACVKIARRSICTLSFGTLTRLAVAPMGLASTTPATRAASS